MKTVSQLDANGYFVSLTEADQSPLEEGVFLLPAGCVDVLPGDIPPGTRAKFNGVAFVFEDIPTPVLEPVVVLTLDDMKAAKWNSIKSERDKRTQTGGYYVAPHWYHSDTFSRTQQIGLVLLGVNIPAGTMWKTLDNGLIAMTPALAGQIFGAAAMSDIAIFAAAEAHKAAMLASVDPTAYDFSGGWPAMYEAAL